MIKRPFAKLGKICSDGIVTNCSGSAAFAPRSGEFIISFTAGNPYLEGSYKISAYNKPYHRYNLFELLKQEP